MRVDVHKPSLDVRDAMRVVRGFRFMQQRVALEVGFQNDVDQAFGTVRRFLCKAADTPARRNRNRAGFRRQFAPNGVKQRRFADAVAADEADACAGYDLHRALVDQKASGNPDGNVIEGEHGGLLRNGPPNATALSVIFKLKVI